MAEHVLAKNIDQSEPDLTITTMVSTTIASAKVAQMGLAAKCVAKIIDNDSVINSLGIRLCRVEAGCVVLTMIVRADMLNSLNQCHGGMSFTLADAAFACASASNNQASVGAHAAMDYIRPAVEGDVLTATATVRHQGKSASLVEVVVENQHGKQVALLHGRSHNFPGTFVDGETTGNTNKS